jgi:outer membrane protein assembly factor BamB
MGNNGKMMPRRAYIIVALMLLGGCESWFGAQEDPPLPGKRLSVLLLEKTLVPDPEAASEEILLPPPSVNPDWPQAGGTANHAMHHTEVAEDLRRAWQADIGSGSDDTDRIIASPIVAQGSIFAMDAETVVSAFDAENGRRLWTVELTPEEEDDGHIGGGLAFYKGRVFVTTGFAEVIALDAETGAVVWRQTLGGPMRAAPTVRGGRLFAVTIDNKVYALATSDGVTLWTHSGISETASLLGGGSPAVDAGVVVVPYSSGELVALKVETGRVLWTESLARLRRTDVISSLAHIRGRPVIDRGRVFAIGHGDQMVAIDLRSGQRIWDKEIGGLQSLWVAGNYLFTLSNNAELVALARDDGRIHWVTQLPRFEDEEDRRHPIVWTGPLLASDRLIVAGSEGTALAISPYSGEVLGKIEMPDRVNVDPIVANRSIYFLADNAQLVAYR